MGWPGPMTHRQFAAWTAWLRTQWNEPDRGDYYQMQVAAEVRSVLGKRPDLKSVRLKFDTGQKRALTQEELKVERDRADAIAKARWLPVLGAGPIPTGPAKVGSGKKMTAEEAEAMIQRSCGKK